MGEGLGGGDSGRKMQKQGSNVCKNYGEEKRGEYKAQWLGEKNEVGPKIAESNKQAEISLFNTAGRKT